MHIAAWVPGRLQYLQSRAVDQLHILQRHRNHIVVALCQANHMQRWQSILLCLGTIPWHHYFSKCCFHS